MEFEERKEYLPVREQVFEFFVVSAVVFQEDEGTYQLALVFSFLENI